MFPPRISISGAPLSYSAQKDPFRIYSVQEDMLSPMFNPQELIMALYGLDWIGLDWIGLGWIGLDWVGLDWIGLGWIGLDWIGLDWIGLSGSGWWWWWWRLRLGRFRVYVYAAMRFVEDSVLRRHATERDMLESCTICINRSWLSAEVEVTVDTISQGSATIASLSMYIYPRLLSRSHKTK